MRLPIFCSADISLAAGFQLGPVVISGPTCGATVLKTMLVAVVLVALVVFLVLFLLVVALLVWEHFFFVPFPAPQPARSEPSAPR